MNSIDLHNIDNAKISKTQRERDNGEEYDVTHIELKDSNGQKTRITLYGAEKTNVEMVANDE